MVKCRCGVDLGPMERSCPICGEANPMFRGVIEEEERPTAKVEMVGEPGKYFLVDGLTLKDYYDIRDLRLLLWGLERELGEKYGITEATELGARVKDLIKEKIREIEAKLHSSPPPISALSADLCPLLKEVAEALYYIYDVKPEGVSYPAYETLYLKVADLMKKLGCPE